MLSLQSVSKSFVNQSLPAVRDVSLSLKQGELLALIGHSGSGKTTLLRLIAGLEVPDTGEISLQGKLISSAGKKAWLAPEKRGIGLVFQDGALFPHLNVAKNIGYGLKKRQLSEAERRDIVAEMMEITGLSAYGKRYPHELSGGERQRVALARALAPNPQMLLFDEPFSNLDPALRRSIREEIREILERVGASAIVVSHDTDDALAIGDRVVVFREGKIEQEGSPGQVYQHPETGYCARLFGSANLVQLNGGQPKWFRPEQMQLKFEAESEQDLPVVIEKIYSAGKHWEARLKCQESRYHGDEQGHWTAIVDREEQPQAGQRAWVSVPG